MSRRARFDRRRLVNPVAYAIEAASKLHPSDRANLQRIIDDAWMNFRCGRDCAKQWRELADALNTAECLSKLGICSDEGSRSKIAAAQQVLAAVASRQHQIGTWALRSYEEHCEATAIDDALFIARIQLEHCSLGELDKARKTVAERTRHALAGNVAPGVLMVEARV